MVAPGANDGGGGGGVELFGRREATASVGTGPKKWALQVALDVSLRFLFRRNDTGGEKDADGRPSGGSSNSVVLTPTRARELEERGWAVRGEEPAPPVLQRMRELQEMAAWATGGSGLETQAEAGAADVEAEEEEAKMGGMLGWVGAVADGAWGIATGRWLWGGGDSSTSEGAAAVAQQQQRQKQLASTSTSTLAAPGGAASRGASVGGKVTEGAGLHGVGGVGGSLIPHPEEGEPWANNNRAQPSPPSQKQPLSLSQQSKTEPKKQQPPPTIAGKSKSTPRPSQQRQQQQRVAIPLSPTAAVAASETLGRGRDVDEDGDDDALSAAPRDRKRDRLRRFLGGLLRLPASAVGGGGQRARARARAGRGGVSPGRRSELARGLGLSEAETMGAGTARGFGGIGLGPALEGPMRLRPLGKRERAGYVRLYLVFVLSLLYLGWVCRCRCLSAHFHHIITTPTPTGSTCSARWGGRWCGRSCATRPWPRWRRSTRRPTSS
jgi:hypothetical protein